MALELRQPLLGELGALERSLRRLARREARVVKAGRTHFQDAVPIRYDQVFTGWAQAVRDAASALEVAAGELRAIGLGGTAAGTGLTAHPRFAALVTRELSKITGERLRPAVNTMTTSWSLRPLLACSAALRGIAIDLGIVCFDLSRRSAMRSTSSRAPRGCCALAASMACASTAPGSPR